MAASSLTEKLGRWVAGGGRLIGQIAISSGGSGYTLHHVDDGGAAEGLEVFSTPADARAVIRFDAGGEYRPLKSAPDLRRGWKLELGDAGELREALEYFYPASLGTWFANELEPIGAVPLREVLGRQTGMYRSANNLSDSGAMDLVRDTCSSASGCLKRVGWPLTGGQPIASLPESELGRGQGGDGEMPMLCVEACNWLVAKARKASAAEFEAGSRVES